MDQLYDAMLVVISGCSALYCYMLGRRLRSLHNLRKGMGKAVAQMTQSIGAVESHATKMNRETTTTVAELSAMFAKVDAYESRVDLILETMDRQARETWKDYQGHARKATMDVNEASVQLSELMNDAKSLAGLMNKQILAMAEVADRQQALLDALKRAEKKKVHAMTQPETPVRSLAEVRDAAEVREGATNTTVAVSVAKAPGRAAQRPWANEAAAATSSGDAPQDIITKRTSRVAELAQRIAAERSSVEAADKSGEGNSRRPNPFIRQAVKRAMK